MRTNTKVIGGLIGIVLLNIFSSLIFSIMEKINFFTAFLKIWENIFSFTLIILSVNLQIWQFLVFIMIVVLIIILIVKFNIKNYPLNEPEYMKYLSGKYKGINYKWRFSKYGNTLSIEDFHPVCSCGGELTLRSYHGSSIYSQEKLFCVNCEKIIQHDYNHEIDKDANLYFKNILSKKIEEHNQNFNS